MLHAPDSRFGALALAALRYFDETEADAISPELLDIATMGGRFPIEADSVEALADEFAMGGALWLPSGQPSPTAWHRGTTAASGKNLAICDGPKCVAVVLGDGYPLGVGNGPESDRVADLVAQAPDLRCLVAEFVAAFREEEGDDSGDGDLVGAMSPLVQRAESLLVGEPEAYGNPYTPHAAARGYAERPDIWNAPAPHQVRELLRELDTLRAAAQVALSPLAYMQKECDGPDVPTIYCDGVAALTAALAGRPLGEVPAIKALATYAADAPDCDPGEGNWTDLETAHGLGQRRESAAASILMRDALRCLGLDAPAGKGVCPGCGRDLDDGEHDSDCELPVWQVQLFVPDIQVTAKDESAARCYAEADLGGVTGWRATVGDLLDGEPEQVGDVEGPELETTRMPEDGSELWTLSAEYRVTVRAPDEELAIADALAALKFERMPGDE